MGREPVFFFKVGGRWNICVSKESQKNNDHKFLFEWINNHSCCELLKSFDCWYFVSAEDFSRHLQEEVFPESSAVIFILLLVQNNRVLPQK